MSILFVKNDLGNVADLEIILDGFAAMIMPGMLRMTHSEIEVAPSSGIRFRSDFSLPLHPELSRGQENTEMFELEDLDAAVEAARKTFTIVELGAGYGRWSVLGMVKAQDRGRPGFCNCC